MRSLSYVGSILLKNPHDLDHANSQALISNNLQEVLKVPQRSPAALTQDRS